MPPHREKMLIFGIEDENEITENKIKRDQKSKKIYQKENQQIKTNLKCPA